ncbi:MAG: lysine--tRNA ligase [Rickettsiaceae bacterium]|nr:lysine--tRNA ligase [Rickettsiaceae bacterium]
MIEAQIFLNLKSWPFLEARKILEHINNKTPQKGFVLFETGYGPSGLPHIGTFSEVARTTMVRYAFSQISDIPTKLICFSDDMDGVRKVPTNIPNQDMVAKYLDRPLTDVPDPYGETKSYGHYMNAKLRSFLDSFNFEYEFYSATDFYKSGRFDETLLKVLKCYDDVMNVMLPSLREERQRSYSPFLPICPKTGKVLQVAIVAKDVNAGTISYIDESGELINTPVTGGHCKLQWKPDFAARWAAMDVNYEMYGKDHRPNALIYSSLCKILGGTPPVQFFYELFLNEAGEKISKSKGNSISVDEWMKYAPLEAMVYFIYQSPEKAKRLFFDVIPKNVDEYLMQIAKYHGETDQIKRYDNPVYHIHKGEVPKLEMFGISFSLLLNLVAACNTGDEEILKGFIEKYIGCQLESSSYLNKLLWYAINYYHDFVEPNKKFLQPDEEHKAILRKIIKVVETTQGAENIQNAIYDIGMTSGFEGKLREFFQLLYQILLGQTEGPRIGSLLALLGQDKAISLLSVHIAD